MDTTPFLSKSSIRPYDSDRTAFLGHQSLPVEMNMHKNSRNLTSVEKNKGIFLNQDHSEYDNGCFSTVKQNDVGKQNPQTLLPQSSSQTFKNHLEEMELKIRYIKNDIEFKQEQIRQKKLTDSSLGSRSKTQDLYCQNAPSSKLVRKIASSQGNVKTFHHFKSISNKSNSKSIPHVIVPKNRLEDKGTHLSSTNSEMPYRKDPTFDASTLKKQKSDLTPISSVNTESTTKSQSLSRYVIAPKSKLRDIPASPSSLTMPLHRISQNRRTVIFSKAGYQNLTGSVINAQKQVTVSDDNMTLVNSVPVLSSYKSSHPSTSSSSTSNTAISKSNTFNSDKSPTKYKYVAPISTNNSSKTSPSVVALVNSSKTTDVTEKCSTKYKYLAPTSIANHNFHPSTSQSMHCPVPSVKLSSNQTTLSTPCDRRPFTNTQALDETKSLKRMTPLKIKTAAKLVSKYKLKRLSPTSLSKVVPQFCSPSTSSSLRSERREQMSSLKVKSSAKIVSKYKLKRLSPSSISSFTPSTLFATQKKEQVTPLMVRSAAKLVSKYKLKRLSPTSASRLAPRFCSHGALPYKSQKKSQNSNSLRYKCTGLKRTNLFKLDKRNITNITDSVHQSPENLQRSNDDSLLPKSSILRRQTTGEKTSKSRFSIRYNRSISDSKVCKERSQTQMMSVLPVSSYKKHRHQWISTDAKIKDLKRSIAAKRYAALAHVRWNFSSASSGTHCAKWSNIQDSQHSHWPHLRHLQKSKYLIGDARRNSTFAQFSSHHPQRASKLVMIGGTVYRSSPRTLKRAVQVKENERKLVSQNLKHPKTKLIYLRGCQYQLDAKGKKLCRVYSPMPKKAGPSNIPGRDSFKQSKLGMLEKVADNPKKAAASRAVQRSLAYVAAKHKKDNQLKKRKQQYCKFFCRFGKCHRGNACPYVHDHKKVVVCTRFLRGKCDVANCLFSHDASAHKMPVCLYYLQGLCSRQDCLYLHVNVSPDAPPCKEFLQGYCPLGKKCKKLHSFVCPSFSAFGKCMKGDRCSLLHRHSKKSGTLSANFLVSKSSSALPGKSVSKPEDKAQCEPSTSRINTSTMSSPVMREPEEISQLGKFSPLKSQPAFISLPTLSPSNLPKANCNELKTKSLKSTTTKIKPEFFHFKAESPTKRESEIGEDLVIATDKGDTSKPATVCLQSVHDDVIDGTERAKKSSDSGFINFSPSASSDFIKVESSHDDSEIACLESSTFQNGIQNQRLDCGKDSPSKSASSKAALLKGIIPNFLPATLPKRNSPASH